MNELSVDGISINYKNKLLMQCYVKSGGSIVKTLEMMKEVYNLNVMREYLSRVLKYPEVRGYLESLLDDLGLDVEQTKERWIADTIRFRDGKKEFNEVSVGMHKMLGQAKGYLGTDTSAVNLNQEIRIVQADGSE